MKCVFGWAGVHYVIVFQVLLPMVLRCARFARARAPLKTKQRYMIKDRRVRVSHPLVPLNHPLAKLRNNHNII